MRLACRAVSREDASASREAYVFDVGARVNGNDVAMLDAEIMSNHTVHARATIIQVVIGQDDQNCVLAFLSLHQDGVTTEQLQSLHGVVGERDHGVVIVHSIRYPVATLSA